jgi:hypothetical protein
MPSARAMDGMSCVVGRANNWLDRAGVQRRISEHAAYSNALTY